MRQGNWVDARAGVRATIGSGADQIHAVGWVDWRRPMTYLALSGSTPGVVTGLVQAVPGLVATRDAPVPPSRTPELPPDGGTRIVDHHPSPPSDLPDGGWWLRHAGAERGTSTAPAAVDALVELLFSMAAARPDAADLLADGESRWLRRDRTGGYGVDVLLGPVALPARRAAGPVAPGSPRLETPEQSLTAMGGGARYWVDDRARLHRVEAVLDAVGVRVDLERDDRTTFPALDLLGGAPVHPRPVTDQEAWALSEVRPRNRAAGGAQATLAIPTASGRTARATGWVDWSRTVGYLAWHDRDQPDGLLWADRTGVAGRPGEPAGPPPLPAPTGGWHREPWAERGDEYGGWDLDLLVHEALSFASWMPDDPELLRETAVWLRRDELAGEPVNVFEIPRSVESGVEAGQARLRYWVGEDSGLLRRLEIRTRSGGYGQLDLDPGPVPYLGLTP
jgi:hypothetical protein